MMSPLKIVAIALFIAGWILAILAHSALEPLFLVVSSFAVLSVFGGVIP